MKKRLLLELIAQYHPDPEKGKQKFNMLLGLNKISSVRENVITMFLEFAFQDNFVEWIPKVLENQSTYYLKPFESASITIREEYLYRKGYRQVLLTP